ncbi:MAG: precorrin-2 C(20)-methyltransferase [Eubacteriales bacterium]
MSKLFGVGVGPGDPELLTLKAVKIIENADIIAIPASGQNVNVAYEIAKGGVQDLDKKHIEELSMPMIRDEIELKRNHDAAAAKIAKWLSDGKDVAFLTLGDPTVYSTYMYIHKRIEKMGFETQIIPGITSFCAVAARLNDSLTEAGEMLHVIPASYEGFEEAMELPGTKILMKSGKQIGKVKKIIKNMQNPQAVKMVERCGMQGERVFNSIDEIDENAGYFSVLLVKEEKKGE